MPRTRTLVDSRLGVRNEHLYDRTGTVQAPTITRDSMGAEVRTWANLADHVGLMCRVSVAIMPGAGAGEVERPESSFVRRVLRAALSGYYPSVTEEMRFVTDGAMYDIEKVEHDTAHQFTYLDLEAVT